MFFSSSTEGYECPVSGFPRSFLQPGESWKAELEGDVTQARTPQLIPKISVGSWSRLQQHPGRGAQPTWFGGFWQSEKGHEVGDRGDVVQPQTGRVSNERN